MSERKAHEDFQADMVDKFLEAAVDDIADMRRMIKNLKLFEMNTPARLMARALLVEELAALQTDLSAIVGGLMKSNTQDTLLLLGDRAVKAESEELLAAFKTGQLVDKKPSAN